MEDHVEGGDSDPERQLLPALFHRRLIAINPQKQVHILEELQKPGKSRGPLQGGEQYGVE